VTGELVTVGVAFLTHRENFIEKFSAALGFLSSVMAFPGLIPPRDTPVNFGAILMNTVKMDFTLS
jgi:hypothetical protein